MAASKSHQKVNRQPSWTRLPKEKLLDLRICDLNLSLSNSGIESRINRLYREMEKQGLVFRPHFWLSDDWFCPDHIPGVAIPFYLAHPRLKKLEKDFVMEVEGGVNTPGIGPRRPGRVETASAHLTDDARHIKDPCGSEPVGGCPERSWRQALAASMIGAHRAAGSTHRSIRR